CANQREKAIEECEGVLAHGRTAPLISLSVASTYAKVGRIEDARKILDEAKKAWEPGSSLSFFIASVHARLGESDTAFEWLEKAYQDRTSLLMNLKMAPAFDGLHGDPRFDALVKRIGIPD